VASSAESTGVARQIPPRAPGDDVILRVRVRRENVPLLVAGVEVSGVRLIELPGIYELTVTNPADPLAFADAGPPQPKVRRAA
jgi:hypothetical protein